MQAKSSSSTLPCERCGVLFTSRASARRRFCSRLCSDAARTTPTAKRFWRYVAKSDTCWLWVGGKSNVTGYGTFYVDPATRRISAHVYSWILHHGPIPHGLWVLHRCDVRLCVNPAHLFLGTHTDNMRDMARKGRQVFQQRPERAARGERNGRVRHPERTARGEHGGTARLTADQVREIRRRYAAGGTTQVALAKLFNIHHSHVSLIVKRKKWAHID